jgi:hypothetical protein
MRRFLGHADPKAITVGDVMYMPDPGDTGVAHGSQGASNS